MKSSGPHFTCKLSHTQLRCVGRLHIHRIPARLGQKKGKKILYKRNYAVNASYGGVATRPPYDTAGSPFPPDKIKKEKEKMKIIPSFVNITQKQKV